MITIANVATYSATNLQSEQIKQAVAQIVLAFADPVFVQTLTDHVYTSTTDTGPEVIAACTALPWDLVIFVYSPGWRFWRRWSSALPWTDAQGIHIYASYMGRATLADLAGTIAHEYQHELGYTHDYNPTPQRPDSEPYFVGNTVVDWVNANKV